MRNIMMFAAFLGLSASLAASSLTRTIGRINSYSADVTIENTDTSKNEYDSLCPRYWFIQYHHYPRYLMDEFYDYRITIHRKAFEPGTLTIFSHENGFGRDTLACDSLGFTPVIYGADTIVNDTTVVYWNYPRVTKRLAGSIIMPELFSNHLKIRLNAQSIDDSIVFSREDVVFSDVAQRFDSDRKLKITDKDINRNMMFDIRGGRLFSPGASSQVVIMAPAVRKDGIAPCRVFLRGR